jgi:hypothetical protein
MRDVFISYRRSDTAGYAGRLLDALEKRFDADKFFRDIEDLAPGVDFPEALNRSLAQCTAMLVVIGPSWTSVASANGPRIMQADDFVRLEVAAGLARKEVRVIPVLVGGAAFPQASELPEDLQALTRRNAFEISDTRWDFDIGRLAEALDSSVRRNLLSGKRALVMGAAVVASAAAIGAYKFVDFSDEDPLVAQAKRDVIIAESKAKIAKADAERAESEAKKRAADRSLAQTASNDAQAAAAATKAAVDQAEAERRVNVNASAQDKAKAEAEAARLAKANEEAQRLAAEKAAQAEAARASEEKAKAEAAALKARQDEEAAAALRTASVAQVAAQTATQPAAAGKRPAGGAQTLSFPNWTLSSGGCGAGAVTVSGTAHFSIEKTAEGIQVREEFQGQSRGFNVVVTGQATFNSEQKSYDLPTTGQWTGPKAFKSSGVDRVNTSDGSTPRTANVIKIQSHCG